MERLFISFLVFFSVVSAEANDFTWEEVPPDKETQANLDRVNKMMHLIQEHAESLINISLESSDIEKWL